MDKQKFGETIIIVLTILFWILVTVIVILGIELLLGKSVGPKPGETKTPAIIRNKI